MEIFSVNRENEKKSSALRALVFEVLIIFFIVIIMLVVLNYFNIINISSYLPFKIPSLEQKTSSQLKTVNQTSGNARTQITGTKNIYKLLKDDGAINFARTEIEYAGVLKGLDTKEGNFFNPSNNTTEEYALKITISAGRSGKPLTSYISKLGLDKIEVYSKNGNSGPTKININDLKMNDNIILNLTNSTIDTYPNDLVKAVITRVTP